jgi:hypothetical protein
MSQLLIKTQILILKFTNLFPTFILKVFKDKGED